MFVLLKRSNSLVASRADARACVRASCVVHRALLLPRPTLSTTVICTAASVFSFCTHPVLRTMNKCPKSKKFVPTPGILATPSGIPTVTLDGSGGRRVEWLSPKKVKHDRYPVDSDNTRLPSLLDSIATYAHNSAAGVIGDYPQDVPDLSHHQPATPVVPKDGTPEQQGQVPNLMRVNNTKVRDILLGSATPKISLLIYYLSLLISSRRYSSSNGPSVFLTLCMSTKVTVR